MIMTILLNIYEKITVLGGSGFIGSHLCDVTEKKFRLKF